MNIPISKLAAPISSLTTHSTILHKQELQNKMATAFKSSQLPAVQKNTAQPATVNLSQEEKMKVDHFVNELQQKTSDKEFFAHVFKTMIRLKKNEKENFIAGVAQTFKSSHDPEISSLDKRFTKALYRYMAVSLMNTPMADQLNENMNKFTLEGEDDDIELV